MTVNSCKIPLGKRERSWNPGSLVHKSLLQSGLEFQRDLGIMEFGFGCGLALYIFPLNPFKN